MEKNNFEKKSELEIVQGLKDKTINPQALSKEQLKNCAETMAMMGNSSQEIGYYLGVNSRTAQRYLKEWRKNNSLIRDPNFQQLIIDDMVAQCSAQYNRLIKLSYSDKASISEIRNLISQAFQIKNDMFQHLANLGYMNRVITMMTADKHIIKKIAFNGISVSDPRVKAINALMPQQRKEIQDYIREVNDTLLNKVDEFVARYQENNKQKDEDMRQEQ